MGLQHALTPASTQLGTWSECALDGSCNPEPWPAHLLVASVLGPLVLPTSPASDCACLAGAPKCRRGALGTGLGVLVEPPSPATPLLAPDSVAPSPASQALPESHCRAPGPCGCLCPATSGGCVPLLQAPHPPSVDGLLRSSGPSRWPGGARLGVHRAWRPSPERLGTAASPCPSPTHTLCPSASHWLGLSPASSPSPEGRSRTPAAAEVLAQPHISCAQFFLSWGGQAHNRRSVNT